MVMGPKAELSAQLSRLGADEAHAYVHRLRAVAGQAPAPLQLGDREIVPSAELVSRLVAHVFTNPAEFERFVRRWYPDAAGAVTTSMPLEAQALAVIARYSPRALAVDLAAYFPDRVKSFDGARAR